MRFAVIALLLSAGSVQAEQPLSAIEWLSESLLAPPNFVMAPPNQPNPFDTTVIVSSSLDLISRDAAGLLPPDITGFPAQLWGNMPAVEVIDILKAHQLSSVTELNSLFRNILLAQADPPFGSGLNNSPILTRIDQLMNIGALDEAETLVKLAGVNEPEIFKRWFEVSILANRSLAVCNHLAKNPDLSDDIATRVICLARSGDWNAAAITLSLSASIGDVEKDREALLLRFLDPDLLEGEAIPEIPTPLPAIDFVLREALGLPRPTTTLPLIFLSTDMGLRIPQRRRMEAAEKLVQAAAVPSSLLFAAYRGGRAASSGGIWGRADAVQDLDLALVGDDDNRLATALQVAFVEMKLAGLLPALAEEYADALAHRKNTESLKPVAEIVQILLLLENLPIAAWFDPQSTEDPAIALSRMIASRTPIPSEIRFDNPIPDAITTVFSGHLPQQQNFESLLVLAESGNIGAAVLSATKLLENGWDSTPQDVQEGLALLIAAGLDGAARRVAIQILLIGLP